MSTVGKPQTLILSRLSLPGPTNLILITGTELGDGLHTTVIPLSQLIMSQLTESEVPDQFRPQYPTNVRSFKCSYDKTNNSTYRAIC